MDVEVSAMTKYWLALSSVKGVGPKTVQMLVNRFGSPREVLSAPVIEIARMPRLNLQLASEIIDVETRLPGLENFIEQMSAEQIDILCPDSCDYPQRLRLIEDFPPILYKRGNILFEDQRTVAIVGTRFPNPGSIEIAERMAARLANMGFVVVSGLASGIDTAAHKGALKAGGRTIAVLGSGLRMVYPYNNSQLANEICNNGAVLSECHPSEVVSGQRLIQRNRITSGLSLGVILIEPGRGASNTAERALKQDRHVVVYSPEGNRLLDPSLSGEAFVMRGMGELDAVVDRMQLVKNRSGQMNLL